jgi:hypothetical protein
VYVIVWEFEVAAGRVADFERAYGPDGEWAAFFRRSDAFKGIELLRGETTDDAPAAHADQPHYWTIDRWNSRDAYEQFNQRFEAEYAAIDTRLAELCDVEVCLGKFETV